MKPPGKAVRLNSYAAPTVGITPNPRGNSTDQRITDAIWRWLLTDKKLSPRSFMSRYRKAAAHFTMGGPGTAQGSITPKTPGALWSCTACGAMRPTTLRISTKARGLFIAATKSLETTPWTKITFPSPGGRMATELQQSQIF